MHASPRRDIIRLCSSPPTLSIGTPLPPHQSPHACVYQWSSTKSTVTMETMLMHTYGHHTSQRIARSHRVCSPTQSAFQSSKQRTALLSLYVDSAAHPEDAPYGRETHADWKRTLVHAAIACSIRVLPYNTYLVLIEKTHTYRSILLYILFVYCTNKYCTCNCPLPAIRDTEPTPGFFLFRLLDWSTRITRMTLL